MLVVKQLESTLTYRWWRDDKQDIPEEHIEELDAHAKDRITEQWAMGNYAGELCETLCLDDSAEEIEYTGWWELNEICK